jgi:ABC-2 type transport system permease protein
MGARPVYLVVRREVVERLRSRSLRIFTLAVMLLAAAGIVAMDQAPTLFGETEYELGVVGGAAPELRSALRRSANAQDVRLRVVDLNDAAQGREALAANELDAYIDGNDLVYESVEATTLTAVVNRAIYELQVPEILDNLGISQAQAEELLNPELANVLLLDPQEATDEAGRRALAALATFALYVTLAMYGNWILTGIVEEKASRVVEVLLGLLRPHELLAGKTLGILIVALIQVAFGVAGIMIGLALVGSPIVPGVALDVAASALTLFLLGLVLYSLMFAAVGSTVARQSEAQSAALPVTLFLLVPYLLALTLVPEQPDSTFSKVLSIFPLTSPIVMPARVAMGSPAAIELVACYALLIASMIAVAWLGGRIYAAAILSSRQVSIVSLLARAVSTGSGENQGGG